jgi:hypothetical protein
VGWRDNGSENGVATVDTRANGRFVPEPVHVVALSGLHTLEEQVRYACEQNRPHPDTEAVLAWLQRYGIHPLPAEVVAAMVREWSRENLPLDESSAPTPRASAAVVDRSRAAGDDASRPAGDGDADGSRGSSTSGKPGKPDGAFGFYLTAVLALVVSVDTSWRFFEHKLGITNLWERAVMFAVLEVALIACGYGMRANVIRHGRPGAPRLFAWLLCGMAGYMAWQLSGLATGIARVALGPVLGLVMLHLALGIEVRARRGTSTTTWARLGRELRERMLSWFGLGDDERDAIARTRDRAARRVVRLSLGTLVPFRSARVARNVRKSNVSHDDEARARMLTELATVRHAAELADLDQPSPWTAVPASTPATDAVNTVADTVVDAPVNTVVNGSVNGAVDGGETATRTRPAASRARSSERPTGRPTGRSAERSSGRRAGGRKPAVRRPLNDYVTAASEHLTEDTVVTPAWVRTVVPGCPRSTSKNVADAINADRAPAREQGQPEEDA